MAEPIDLEEQPKVDEDGQQPSDAEMTQGTAETAAAKAVGDVLFADSNAGATIEQRANDAKRAVYVRAMETAITNLRSKLLEGLPEDTTVAEALQQAESELDDLQSQRAELYAAAMEWDAALEAGADDADELKAKYDERGGNKTLRELERSIEKVSSRAAELRIAQQEHPVPESSGDFVSELRSRRDDIRKQLEEVDNDSTKEVLNREHDQILKTMRIWERLVTNTNQGARDEAEAASRAITESVA